MKHRTRFLSVLGTLGLAASAQGIVISNFEPPTYTAGEHLNSGEGGWVRFGSVDGAVTPDVVSGYTYPSLEGSQSFALFTNAGGYGHNWGAGASQVADGAVVSWLMWTETNTGSGGGEVYLADNINAGSTPAGIQLDEATGTVQLFGAGNFTNSGVPFNYHVNYKLEMDLDFTLDQYTAYITDVTHGGPRTVLGTKPFYMALDASTVAATGGMFLGKYSGSPYMVDDLRIVLPQDGWKTDGSGDWNAAANWQPAAVPNGVDATAVFPNVISSPQTVYTNTAVTVGTLRFDSPSTYVLSGAGSLTVSTSSGTGSVEVLQGSHKINLPLFFASDTNVTVASGATLTIADPATIRAGKTVTKNGNLVIQAPLTLEAGASLVLASGPTTAFGAPSLASGAKIDVKTNSMTVDYRGQASPAATIKSQLASGYASGAWTGEGINTSSAVANQTALGWKDDAASSSILVKYTYYGDANLDGQVDISDLGALATAWQTSAVWSQGDFDYSGFVDISDLGKLATNWQLGVGNPLGPSFDEALASVGLAGVSVPEPASIGVLGMMGVLALRRKHR